VEVRHRVLSLAPHKNGALAAEAVIFFQGVSWRAASTAHLVAPKEQHVDAHFHVAFGRRATQCTRRWRSARRPMCTASPLRMRRGGERRELESE